MNRTVVERASRLLAEERTIDRALGEIAANQNMIDFTLYGQEALSDRIHPRQVSVSLEREAMLHLLNIRRGQIEDELAKMGVQ